MVRNGGYGVVSEGRANSPYKTNKAKKKKLKKQQASSDPTILLRLIFNEKHPS